MSQFRLHNRSILALALIALSCVPEEPRPIFDDQGEEIPVPDPGELWLRIQSVEPTEDLSTRPAIAITFNQYIDPSTFISFSAARLASGGLSYGGNATYRMTRRQVIFYPHASLEPDLTYRLEWTADDVESISGSPYLREPRAPRFRVRDDLDVDPAPSRPQVTWQQVEEIFDAHCNYCHGSDRWHHLPALTPASLIGRPSSQVDAPLVAPTQPTRSYLMHKILPDYPLRRFTVQPPPWSDAEPLSLEQIEQIEDWIANGAPH